MRVSRSIPPPHGGDQGQHEDSEEIEALADPRQGPGGGGGPHAEDLEEVPEGFVHEVSFAAGEWVPDGTAPILDRSPGVRKAPSWGMLGERDPGRRGSEEPGRVEDMTERIVALRGWFEGPGGPEPRELSVDPEGRVAEEGDRSPSGVLAEYGEGCRIRPGGGERPQHPEQSVYTELVDPSWDLATWCRHTIYRRSVEMTPERVYLGCCRAFGRMLLAGVTTVAVSFYCHNRPGQRSGPAGDPGGPDHRDPAPLRGGCTMTGWPRRPYPAKRALPGVLLRDP